MDDNLEQPSFPPPQHPQEEDNGDLSGDDDDNGPDWTKLKSFASSSRPSLPKRGDKEFEPAANGPTNLQSHSLNRARDAMFTALDAERAISNKSVSYAVWYSDLARAHVTQARGVLFNGMGHSVPRVARGGVNADQGVSKKHKRTELLPEETLYLIERGSLFCWKDETKAWSGSGGDAEAEGDAEHDDMHGSPMSVQQAFAEMMGREDLTLDRYHAYAYLKRLGFQVLRAKPPSPSYPTPASTAVAQPSRTHSLAQTFSLFTSLITRLRRWMFGTIDWWKPVHFGWFGCLHNYSSVYQTLRLIPAGHTAPLHSPPSAPKRHLNTAPTTPPTPPPYEIFFHVYKPNTPFRKSAPPPPDYSLVVVNARTTPLPTLHELTRLWSFLPESGPPPPRARRPKAPSTQPPATPPRPATHPPAHTCLARLLAWLPGVNMSKSAGKHATPPRKPHPFAVLKAGKKTVVVGVVDNGTVGFFRFGMGAFEEMPVG